MRKNKLVSSKNLDAKNFHEMLSLVPVLDFHLTQAEKIRKEISGKSLAIKRKYNKKQ